MSANVERAEELILGNPTFSQVTAAIASPMEPRPGPAWWGAFRQPASSLIWGGVLSGPHTATGPAV